MTSIHVNAPIRNLLQNEGAAKARDPLPRLLSQLIARAGGTVMVERAVSRPWASALFQGRRHVVALTLAGPDAAERRAAFVQGIEEAEWSLSGHFVADISIDCRRPVPGGEWVELSALTIEDW
ncbi:MULTISPECIES: hypothetical protein [Sphingobium]|uniref:DUF721 domain-containing protein n=2 Tax=Sphingobium fuliginis (strain ATCC 27551) TaxID=336203 RepID=A0ABQ1EUB6_SPHSA|nr:MULTISPECIES: hypothetical protein [Sphingobium]OAP31880.1 hypothetical protein A8O16_11175 [Sphingobium sp. 20006FA]AJR24467.1 hypothetical protein TZ53_12755 [Sphingobium sp. YBL2]KXU32357.1 hypothetical protein AXW74_07970 [Sphingobium sp. AM]KYC32250.1 hypothetical protein A0J57_11380 [Sphingobium sp. 22B]QDC38900.1 hypothetical protein FIL70_18270 [Sphingobium fuliginis ATCC 27551]